MNSPAAKPTFHLDRVVRPDDLDHTAGRVELIGPDDATLSRAVAAIVGITHQWDGERFSRYPDLRVVSRMGIGYDNVDIAAAHAAGVVVCNAPDAPTVSTAEHTMALLLALTKELPIQQERARQGLKGPPVATALELEGSTLGLVGLGRIARRVERVATALGMTVIATDPMLDTSPQLEVRLVGFDELLATAHVVSLHAPATDATHHMMSTAAFEVMRPGAYLVNCARGSLVDHDALADALGSGRLAGAALDVTDPEPLPASHPLLDRADVIITPHVASSTAAGRRRLFEHAFDNAIAVIEGRPATIVTPRP
jgi:phosphoglycerate dehydrogenase-like enzyme